jgi:hypothetical protein
MKNLNELSLKELMQMSHDIKEMQKDIDMLIKFMGIDEIKIILNKKE